MSNKIHAMQKIQTLDERQQQKAQLELQRQSFIVNTRLQLSQQFLSTLLARLDIEPENEMFKTALPDLAVDYANALMTKLGIVLPVQPEAAN